MNNLTINNSNLLPNVAVLQKTYFSSDNESGYTLMF